MSMDLILVDCDEILQPAKNPICQSRVYPMRNFYISRFQVTQSLYSEIANINPSNYLNPASPVEMVSWFEAVEFCNILSRLHSLKPFYQFLNTAIRCDDEADGYRLPTEAEWEFAAAGGKLSKGYIYPGSHQLDQVGWYKNNSNGTTHPVGLKAPNELGIFDMSGNVWEWCFDPGPDSTTRVYKGGSFLDFEYACTISSHGHRPPNLKQIDIGFRLVKNIYPDR